MVVVDGYFGWGRRRGKLWTWWRAGRITRTDSFATRDSQLLNGDYSATAGSDVVVITAGFPRKAGG